MQTFKRVTALCMVLIMMISAMSLSLVASAVEINLSTDKLLNNQTTGIWQGTVTDSGNANDTNATVLVDFLDEVLKELNIKEEIKLLDPIPFVLSKGLVISIDATSVDALLGTIDLLKNTLGGGLMSAVMNLIGSLGDLEMKNWKTGQSRAKTGDEAILKNLIGFLSDNRNLISDVVDGSFTLGSLADGVLNIDPSAGKTILWRLALLKDGNGAAYAYLSDWLKDTLANAVDAPELASGTLDTIIYDGLMAKKLGVAMNGNTTTEQLILSLVNSLWNKYVGALITKVGEYEAGFSGNEYTAPIAGLVNFDVKAEDVVLNIADLEGVNNALGDVLAKVIPTYTGWTKGADLALISTNLVNVLKWVLASADEAAMTAEVKAKYDAWNAAAEADANTAILSFVKLVVNAAWPESAYPAIVDAQTEVESAIIAVLTQVIAENPDSLGFAVIGAGSTTAEKFLGDFAGSFLAQYIPLRNASGKAYVNGSGTSIYDVANYALNYFLVDLNFDALFGLNMTKAQTLFEKLEILQKMLFGDIEYEKAGTFIPSLVENLLTLDIGGLFTENIKPIVEAYDDLKACNFIYDIINNVLTSIIGEQAFAENFTTFEAIFKSTGAKTDDNLGKTVAALLKGINARKTQLLPIVYYLYNTLLEEAVITVSGTANNINLTGSKAQPGIKVTYNGHTLKENTDYKIVYGNGGKTGTATVSVQGIGNYTGTQAVGTITISCSHSYGKWVSKKTASVCRTRTCSACGYVQSDKAHNLVTDKAVAATYSKSGKTAGSHCSDCGYVKVAQKTVAKKTVAKVTGLKAKSIKVEKSSQITLSWSKVSGADKYEVYIQNGSKWTKLATTSKTSYTVKKDAKKKTLKAGNTYKFKVRAVVEESKKTYRGSYSSVLSVKVVPATPTLTLKAGKKQLTASWKSISGASGYEVQYSTSSKFTKKTTKTVKAKKSAKKTTIKKLKKGKKYYVKVRAYKTVNGKKVYSNWAKVKNVKVK